MRRTRFHGVIAVALAGLCAACSSRPPPKSIADARELLERAETDELQALRPQLIEQARDYEASAQRAWNDGDDREAELYGELSVQRWRTAQNFVRRESAQTLIKSVTRQRDQAASDEARRRQELARLQRLLGRIDQLAAPRPTDDAGLVAAKKSLLEARRKQAEADGVGASVRAPNPYQQGATLLAGAVESLELGMADDSTKNSAGAIAAFGLAIEEARAAAARPKEDPPAPAAAAPPASALPPPTAPPVAAPLPPLAHADADAALRAIHDAEDARADAIGRGGASDAAMAHGDALLDVARRARVSGEAERSVERAKDARRVFAMVRGSVQGRSAVQDLILSLEARRVDLLSEGGATSCPSYEAIRSSLDVAKARLEAGDEARAQEFALIAQQKLRECERQSHFGTAQRAPKADAPEKPAQPAVSPEEQERKRAASAIQKAQSALAEAQVKLGDDSRLPPLTQLVTSAEAWYDRKEWVEAEDLANRATRQIAELLRKPLAPAEPASKPGKEEPPGKRPTEEQAAAAIVDAQRTQAELEGRLGPDERLRKPAQLLESAERWFERKEFDRSLALTKDAQSAQREILGVKPKAGEPRPAEPKPRESAVCRDAREEIEDARFAARSADPRTTGKNELQSAKVLVRSAEDLLEKDQCPTARDLARQAKALVSREAPPRGAAPGARAPEAPGTGRQAPEAPGTGRQAPEAPRKRPAATPGEPWHDAYEAQMRALEKRDEARAVLVDAAEPVFDSGEDALRDAKSLYDQKRYEASEDAARGAIEKFELAIEASRAAGGASRVRDPGRPGEARRPGEAEKPDEADRPGEPSAAKPGAPPREATVQARTEQAITAYERSAQGQKAPSGWQAAYRQVIAALALRDRVTSMATSKPAKDAVGRGGAMLTQARAAYGEKRYPAAEQLATGALAEFQAVLDAQAPLGPTPEVKDDGSDAFKETDQALREAHVLLEVCEREKCAERDFKAYARSKQLLASAREALKDRKYDYAKELADQAKKALEGALEKPSSASAPKLDTADQQKKKLAAEDALREANVLLKLCEQKACDKQNLEVWLRSTSLMNAAKASFADQLHERAREQADEAHRVLRELIDSKPQGLVLPQGVTRVRIDGNNIVAQPPIEFKSGGAVLTENGRATVAEIAAVIKANADRLDSISLVGHTDSRGNANLNRQLSANRARAVMQALVQAGVAQGLMTADGVGPDNPIADNSTDEGRRMNRRVDITVKTK
ncbi:MAG: OmpA family protein [Polyangiaceae bacterium]|nr:OmpA family protein [Polyangiaceae bacterium]